MQQHEWILNAFYKKKDARPLANDWYRNIKAKIPFHELRQTLKHNFHSRALEGLIGG